MAVSRHLGFYRIANSAIWSADPENPILEPNMEWIGCTVCEIFAFKVYCDLETRVRGHLRSSKMALFDIAHTTLYSSSIVVCLYLVPFPNIGRKFLLLLYLAPPLGVKQSDLRNDPWCRKTRIMGLSDSEKISMICSAVLIHVWQTDRQTDRRMAWHTRAIAYMLSREKNCVKLFFARTLSHRTLQMLLRSYAI